MKKRKDLTSYPPKNRRRFEGGHMRPIVVHLPKGAIEKLDLLVQHQLYANRNEAIRYAVNDLIKEELTCEKEEEKK